MDKDDVIRKIQKCLALARSSEPSEAAAGLRQAQALMREYGVSHPEVLAANAQEKSVPAGAQRPSEHETRLANVVADAFGCELILSRGFDESSWLLVGCSPAIDVAGYTMQVLLRAMAKARAAYIKAALKRCGRKNKTARADVFCQGWVRTAVRGISPMDATADQAAAVAAYLETYHPALGTFAPRRPKSAGRHDTSADHFAGLRTGRDVSLHHGLGSNAAPLMLEG